MAKVLSCACGDCVHWEVIVAERGVSLLEGFAVPPVDVDLRCKTCGKDYEARLNVESHADLREVEREA